MATGGPSLSTPAPYPYVPESAYAHTDARAELTVTGNAPLPEMPEGVNVPIQTGSTRAVKTTLAAAAATAIVGILINREFISSSEGMLVIPVVTGIFAGFEKWFRERKLWA